VTGGTGVLGSAIVAHLCARSACPEGVLADGSPSPVNAEHAQVIANYRRDHQRALSLRQSTGCGLYRADVGDEKALSAMFEALPPLQAVIHAAAISSDAVLPALSRAAWRETMRVNVDGAFLVVRAALGKLAPGGHLLLLGSRAGERGNRGQAAYAASKAALFALARCAAREAAQRHIAVNVICPGFVPSGLSQAQGEAASTAYRRQSVLGTTGSAAELVATVDWLLSDAAAAITGQIIHCDSRIG